MMIEMLPTASQPRERGIIISFSLIRIGLSGFEGRLPEFSPTGEYKYNNLLHQQRRQNTALL